MKYLRLLRFQNLLIVAATQYLLLYCIIMPYIQYFYAPLLIPYNLKLELQFSDFNFFLLSLSTVLITAAGYVINDYFDRKTDFYNRPKKVIIGIHVSTRAAMAIHWIFTSIGVLLGFYVSYKIGFFNLGIIFAIVSISLWFYSTNFNSQFLVGNLLIALLTALVPLFASVFQIIPLNKVYALHLEAINLSFHKIIVWTLGYAIFAFIVTLIREIVKDMEDMEGDSTIGRSSLPIVLGMKATKSIVLSLISLTIVALYIALNTFIESELHATFISFIYFTLAVVLPLCGAAFWVFKAQTAKAFRNASHLLKIVMVGGILFMIIVKLAISGII
ncbi:MAG: geranylgeranylglycerol-phosphate geranylgeranyltransferase [Bacteroidales bacterium]|nr:geranylgeranylglycerol-phosphate geranylgeranyltransferase [Bacteroidales bacterium]